MIKSTISFKEFVMSQPADRKIDHNCWGSCAVGDYVSKVKKKRRDSINGNKAPILIEQLINDFALYTCLNENGDDNSGKRVIHNYGDIQDYYNGKLELVIGEKS